MIDPRNNCRAVGRRALGLKANSEARKSPPNESAIGKIKRRDHSNINRGHARNEQQHGEENALPAGSCAFQVTTRSMTKTGPRIILAIHPAEAKKCGICQKKRIAKSVQARRRESFRAAAHPINGGNAPGIAPTRVFAGLIRLSGV